MFISFLCLMVILSCIFHIITFYHAKKSGIITFLFPLSKTRLFIYLFALAPNAMALSSYINLASQQEHVIMQSKIDGVQAFADYEEWGNNPDIIIPGQEDDWLQMRRSQYESKIKHNHKLSRVYLLALISILMYISFETVYITQQGLYLPPLPKSSPFIIKMQKKYLQLYLIKENELYPFLKLKNTPLNQKRYATFIELS